MTLICHKEIEKKWNRLWERDDVYHVKVVADKSKFYCLDMFPYPSGAGLHVGHPLGYIATDILCRFKRLKGDNVLHALGFDSFGLPAEQFAIETGQHPAVTTEQNIATFKAQLRRMGLSLDQSKEFKTSDKAFYQWTQWIFIQLFNAWYDKESDKAKHISELISHFNQNGSHGVNAEKNCAAIDFTKEDWLNFSKKQQAEVLMDYRLAYLSYATVNWCPELGTVLANDEVINGLSERGGHPVEKRKMRQWMLRITAYAERMLTNLETLNWPNHLKELQKNWIGKSQGIAIQFNTTHPSKTIQVYSTKPETIFGVTFLCISPEYNNLSDFITEQYKTETDNYIELSAARTERERMSNPDRVTGVFTGSYAVNPVNNQKIPIWIGDYVLSGYGSGAVMGVPAGDDRDQKFAEKYSLPCIQIFDDKREVMIQSDFLNGQRFADAREAIINYLEDEKYGSRKTYYKMRDAIFGRQRYWGEPVPIWYDEDGIPQALNESDLPLELPVIDQYTPTATGQPPLAHAKEWLYKGKYRYELTTMPGWAGSSWYFLRYMSDKQNPERLVNDQETQYWRDVDLYVGGSEHATGHLLYARFWNLFLYDLDIIDFDEPFKTIVNQGMIQGRSSFIYRIHGENTFVSCELKDQYNTQRLHVDIKLVNKDDSLCIEQFKQWRKEYKDSQFIYQKDKFFCDFQIEKMSKSKYNTVNPDEIIDQFGADVFRMYEMFLGPIIQSKPWNLSGIEGINKFIHKVWRLFYSDDDKLLVSYQEPQTEELKVLHEMLHKVAEDIERLSFNTAISSLMICVNKLTQMQCHKFLILHDLLLALSPFAVYSTQELWSKALQKNSYIIDQSYPEIRHDLLWSDHITYPVTINGKMRLRIELEQDLDPVTIKKRVLSEPGVKKYIKDKKIKDFIFVPKRIINIVI